MRLENLLMNKQESKKRIGVVAGGPESLLANLVDYQEKIDFWIGCDRGNLYLIEQRIPIDLAVGDFDSVDPSEFNEIKSYAKETIIYPAEKDLTDLELAINEAKKHDLVELYLFGVTGGRKDHELAAVFLLEKLLDQPFRVLIIDRLNQLTALKPGKYQVERHDEFENISLIPLTKQVTGLTLTNFYYPLKEVTITRGDSLTISNYLIEQTGHVSFDSGILIVIKSSD